MDHVRPTVAFQLITPKFCQYDFLLPCQFSPVFVIFDVSDEQEAGQMPFPVLPQRDIVLSERPPHPALPICQWINDSPFSEDGYLRILAI